VEQLVAEYGSGSPQPRFPCWPAHQARALVLQPVWAAIRDRPMQNTVRDGFCVLYAERQERRYDE
jgi:hypothetical protein